MSLTMKRRHSKIYSIVNISFIILIWWGPIFILNRWSGWRLGIWLNVCLALIGLVLAGYLVQYLVSPVVNRCIMHLTSLSGKIDPPGDNSAAQHRPKKQDE